MTEKQETQFHEEVEKFFEKREINNVSLEDTIRLTDSIASIVKKQSYIGQVNEFHETFNQYVGHKPEIPNKEIIELRLGLLLEELVELAEGCGSEALSNFGVKLFKKSEEVRQLVEAKREKLQPDIVACVDAFADLQYVLSGAILTFGLQNKFNECFEEVHSSNMSKACINQEEVEKTQNKYDKEGVETYPLVKNGYYIILRKSDNKVLKSINYKPAQLGEILEKA